MPAIVTITFSPAIDKSTILDSLIPEKKLYCSSPVYEPGGGGINVARAIKKLGGKATAIYLAGGHSGIKFIKLLSEQHINSILIETRENSRENLTVLETSTNKQYRFVMPASKVYKKEWQQCLTILKNLKGIKYIVSSGSLSPNIPTAILAKIAKIAKNKNAKFIIDSSGEALKKAVEVGVFMIKPNLKELSALVGKEEISADDVAEIAKEIINNGGCEIVVVSLGALGAIMVTKEKVFRIKSPDLSVKSTVGAGDSMLAGIVLSFAKNRSMLEALQYGVACGSAAAMNDGTELCHKEDVDRLYNFIKKQSAI